MPLTDTARLPARKRQGKRVKGREEGSRKGEGFEKNEGNERGKKRSLAGRFFKNEISGLFQ